MSSLAEYTAGIQIETNIERLGDEGTPGVLGCYAMDASKRYVLLSNAHALFPGFQRPPGLAVYYDTYSTCCSGGPRIARHVINAFDGFSPVTVRYTTAGPPATTGTASGSETDCAIAVLVPGLKFCNVYRTPSGGKTIPITGAVKSMAEVVIGPPVSTDPKKPSEEPSPEQLVQILTKRRVIWGTVMAITTVTATYTAGGQGAVERALYPMSVFGDDDAQAGAKPTINQLLILPRPTRRGKETFREAYKRRERLGIEHGDSGSVVINAAGKVIGLLSRGYPASRLGLAPTVMEYRDVGMIGIANPIDRVTKALGITIMEHDKGFGTTVPAPTKTAAGERAPELDAPGRAAQERGLARLRDGLRRSRRGHILLAKVSQHGREVRRLLARVRALASVWQRLKGPAFYQHCVLGVRRPGHQVPSSIDGVTRDELAAELLPMLERHASPALARDIARYRAWATAVLLHVASLDEVPDVVARPWRPQ